jgi:hypothetical protein
MRNWHVRSERLGDEKKPEGARKRELRGKMVILSGSGIGQKGTIGYFLGPLANAVLTCYTG